MKVLTKVYFVSSAVPLHIKNIFLSTLLQPLKLQKYNTHNYILQINTIEIIICFNIPHFQLLLLHVVISFHDVRK